MLSNEIISEIAATSVSLKSIIDSNIIKSAEIVGQIDGRKVGILSNNSISMYFFKNDTDTLQTYIIISNEHNSNGYIQLHRIFNDDTQKGVVTALIIFVIASLHKKLFISADEKLTNIGMEWLCKMIQAGGRGLKISDNAGNIPSITDIRKEWKENMLNDTPGKLEIFLENRCIVLPIIIESWLMAPMCKYIGNDIFL